MSENEKQSESFKNFLFISKVVEINKCAADLLFTLEKAEKLKDDLGHRCAEIGVEVFIDGSTLRWKELGAKDLPQKL